MNKKNILTIIISVIVFIILIWYFSSPDESSNQTILVIVQSGQFVIDVTTTGELEARSSENILGPNPMRLRDARIFEYGIEDIIPDGTVVDSGQWIATLDRSDLENKIKDQELEVEKLQTQFVKSQLDTTMTLRNARDELINLKYAVEEKKIIVDQSIYEPPASQRQVKIDLEKTERAYSQALENYSLKFQKAKADMKEVEANLTKAQRKLNANIELKEDFVVKAPKSGMLNYKRGWDGKKVGVGSRISAWDNVVATLPNLSAMNSRTYINEIDISKVASGQDVEIEVDAFPGKILTGEVNEVANMGEQMQNSNAKVFEVSIHINEFDSILRPSMTTKNRIITEIIEKAIFVPVECMNANDSITFVYSEGKRKQVVSGKSNETDIVVLAGLKEGDEVYLLPPDNAESWNYKLLDKEILKKFEEAKTEKKDNDAGEEEENIKAKKKGEKQDKKRGKPRK